MQIKGGKSQDDASILQMRQKAQDEWTQTMIRTSSLQQGMELKQLLKQQEVRLGARVQQLEDDLSLLASNVLAKQQQAEIQSQTQFIEMHKTMDQVRSDILDWQNQQQQVNLQLQSAINQLNEKDHSKEIRDDLTKVDLRF